MDRPVSSLHNRIEQEAARIHILDMTVTRKIATFKWSEYVVFMDGECTPWPHCML